MLAFLLGGAPGSLLLQPPGGATQPEQRAPGAVDGEEAPCKDRKCPVHFPPVLFLRSPYREASATARSFAASWKGRILGPVVLNSKGRLSPGALENLPETAIVLAFGGRPAVRALPFLGKHPFAVAGVLSLSRKRFKKADWFSPMDLDPLRIPDMLARDLPEVDRAVVFLPKSAGKSPWKTLVEKAKKKGLSLRPIPIGKPAEVLKAVSSFPDSSELIILLPDPRTTPMPGSRLDAEFERILIQKDLFVLSLRKGHLKSRAAGFLQLDTEAYGRALADLLRTRPKGDGKSSPLPAPYRWVRDSKTWTNFQYARKRR